jgi:S-adenosylmethionine:tRNA-ribosyltransferase-isomerase (queuine synthetase)
MALRTRTSEHKNKHLILNQTKIKKAQKILGAKTDTETVELALDKVIDEAEANQRAREAHERFIREAIGKGIQIRDVFGRLDGVE